MELSRPKVDPISNRQACSDASQSASPLAAWPRSRNVLGYEPWPQISNEPKSLNQEPSGTSGLDSIQTRSRLKIGDADCPVAHPVDQMQADVLWKIVPMSDLGHQPLKTIRPSSSPRRFASSGSVALRKRSASSKNSCCLRFSASIPFSMSSTSIRLELSLRFFAMLRTCAAILTGRLTLWRTVLFIAPV